MSFRVVLCQRTVFGGTVRHAIDRMFATREDHEQERGRITRLGLSVFKIENADFASAGTFF